MNDFEDNNQVDGKESKNPSDLSAGVSEVAEALEGVALSGEIKDVDASWGPDATDAPWGFGRIDRSNITVASTTVGKQAIGPATDGKGSDDRAFVDELMKAQRLMRERLRMVEDQRSANKEREQECLRALKLLALAPQMRQLEMADLLGLRLRVLDEEMARMEQAGLVSRELPSMPDMRIVQVSLTDSGRLACEQGLPASMEPELLPGFSAKDRDDLIHLLQKANIAFEALGLHDDVRHGRGGYSRGDRDSRDRLTQRRGARDWDSHYQGSRNRSEHRGERDRGGYGRGPREERGSTGRASREGRGQDRGNRGTRSARYGHEDRGQRNGFGRHNPREGGFGSNRRNRFDDQH